MDGKGQRSEGREEGGEGLERQRSIPIAYPYLTDLPE